MFFQYFIDYNRYLNIIGIFVILLIAFLFSKNRSKISYKLIISALSLQFLIGICVLKTDLGQAFVGLIAKGVNKIYMFADCGTNFVFGNLTKTEMPWGLIFAFKILPIFIFFAALTSLLFHFGIVQICVSGINFLLRPILGTSGAETLCAVANSFLGQTEAPLLIRNYLNSMTKSEMFVVMVSGMATISGAVLALYSSPAFSIPAKHLLAASVMGVPASILIAKIILPETETPETAKGAKITFERKTNNVFDAIASGTSDGLWLAINVGAMLIVFISLIGFLNFFLDFGSTKINELLVYLGTDFEIPKISLGYIFETIFSPFTYLLGLSGTDLTNGAELLGTKVSVNELVAYSKVSSMHLSERTTAIMTYALCGFANFSSIGIQIGGIGALVPEKRHWLTELGLIAVLASSLANLLSAAIAGILL